MVGDLGKKIIITGAAGTGKTTLINALREQGFRCLEEISRSWIDHQLATNGEALPWKDVKAFSEGCLEQSNLILGQHQSAAFCDRGPLDYQVHLMLQNEPMSDTLNSASLLELFDPVVFYCPTWEAIYQQEPQRPEPFEHQLEVDRLTREMYMQAEFSLIEIPKTTVAARVSFVLNHLDQKKVSALKA